MASPAPAHSAFGFRLSFGLRTSSFGFPADLNSNYRDAINLPCDWIIVTSMRETRLYYKGAHQQAYGRFDTVRLAADGP
jgi:hypothetical protein